MAEENQTNLGGTGVTGGTSATSKFETGKTHARKAAENLRDAATDVASEYRGKAEQAWDDATSRARTLQEDGEQFVRENPTKAVFTALGIGFVLGLIFRR